MRKQVIIQIVFCVIISIANASSKLLPLTEIYLKNYACEFSFNTISNTKLFSKIKTNITENEFKEIKNIKINFCSSSIKL